MSWASHCRTIVALVALFALGLPDAADAADSFTTLGAGLRDRDSTEVQLQGYFRSRAVALRNADLDAGVGPSGAPLYAVPAGVSRGQWLTHADMRLRTDVSIFAPRGGVVVRARADFLDNLAWGSQPIGAPSGSTSQRTDGDPIRLRRLYAEAALPFGVLAVGRMANTWGTGMLANGGDGLDMDSADAVDRAALVTPLAGHVWALAFDLSASGPLAAARPGAGSTDQRDATPADDVRSVTVAVLRGLSDATLARRDAAGLTSFDYGAVYAYRWQDLDSAQWLPGATEASASVRVQRGFSAHLGDVWLRAHGPMFDVQAEVAVLGARYEQPSIIPGVAYRLALESLQIGAVLRARAGSLTGLHARFLAAFASGDPAPGMGYFQPIGAPPRPGDLHGAQADIPRDARIDNFRFHPDFRVDRLLFRELVGGLTDTFTARAAIARTWTDFGAGALTAELAGIFARALHANSTPGGAENLGIELDPTLTYRSKDGFRVQLQYAALLPMAGMDNPITGQTAQPAQLWRLHLGYLF